MAADHKRMAKPKTRASKPKERLVKVAPSGSQAPSADEATPEGKSIFLFADGTGNSSAKLFKTNVWRMYEAIDFGLASPGGRVQVGYYDNGVGTSNFRPLALLGGVFGIGLKSNVLRLYTFLCRNYQPGDRIYAFGFSRGAFTIRMLVGLIATQGVLQPAGDAELSYQVHDAYRAFRTDFEPNRWLGKLIVAFFRALRDGVVSLRRRMFKQQAYCDSTRIETDIEFVGVWDTVAAYGGPFAEFTRGIDDWVLPLTMPDYGLSPKVRKARHALSLDDERDAFRPLLWDEVREQASIDHGDQVIVGQGPDGKPITEVRKVAPDRLRQVWFAGVHSDVGGGYPDESLSYIPLLWMMDELGGDVDFLQEFVQRAQDLANPYGPIHDSRAGLGAYYRYQPRKIAAFTDPPTVATRSLRPPESDGRLGAHGLLRSVCVHESAIARILSGIDNYAPAALPANFAIVHATGPKAAPALTASSNALLAAAVSGAEDRYEHQENAWDLAWQRRIVYFGTVALTLALVALPLLTQLNVVEDLCSDDRCFARSLVDAALFFIPAMFRQLLVPWLQKPLSVILLGVVIFVLIGFGRREERQFRDRVKGIWRSYIGRSLSPSPDPTGIRRFRESAAYQTTFYFLKWQVLPAICGLLTLVTISYAFVAVVTQTLYAAVEPRSTFCKPPRAAAAADRIINVPFDTADSCTDLGLDVAAGHPYRLTLKANPPSPKASSPWIDGDSKKAFAADPRKGVTERHGYMMILAPLKRVTSANWMQVLTEVRAKQPGSAVRQGLAPVFGPPIDLRKHELEFLGDATYQTFFCPRWDGRLYLMVNDAAPLLSEHFYKNNHGSAQVSVEPAPNKKCVP
jgi:uncharacterized protein (DUF2235 family)